MTRDAKGPDQLPRVVPVCGAVEAWGHNPHQPSEGPQPGPGAAIPEAQRELPTDHGSTPLSPKGQQKTKHPGGHSRYKPREELVLNDIVDVSIEAAEAAIKTDDWRLGYALTVHSSQGLTIHAIQKVWIIDDYLQWSNLAYLAIARVEYLTQLERVTVHRMRVQRSGSLLSRRSGKRSSKNLWPTSARTRQKDFKGLT